MESLLARLPSRSRIAVIRLRSMGDCVLTTPALALLKAHRPDLKVLLVVEPRFAGLFEDNPDVDEIAPEVDHADLVLNLHGGTRSMWMTLASGAKFRAGFANHRFSGIYSNRIPRAQEILGEERPVHTAEHLASAMFWLGVPRTEIPRAKLFASTHSGTSSPYVILHPFAAAAEKTWPFERFVAAADQLQAAGLEPKILAGPADDASPFSRFKVFRDAPLSEVKSLMSGAALFIGNDSGPAHVAAAFGIPVVVLFGPSDPVTWAPWRTEGRVLTARGSISQIEVEEVMAAAEGLRQGNVKAEA